MSSTVADLSRRAGMHALLFILLYFIFEACFVSFISLGAGLDDAELISNLSFWNWGYGGSQPPLYTWIAYGVTQLFGLHFPLLQCLRFAVLFSTFVAVYAGLRLLNVRPAVAGRAMLSLFLLPQIGWESQRALIHSVMGTAGSAWCFAAFAWFMKKRNLLSAILFGLAIAAAVLGKYNGGVFVVALLFAALVMQETRPLLKTWLFALSLFTAAVAMAPALFFMILHPKGVMARASKFNAGLSGNPLWDRFAGLLDLSVAAFSFILLAAGIGAVIILLTRRKRIAGPTAASWAERFLGLILLGGLLLMVLIILVSGATHIKDRWLQPVLFMAPAYFSLFLTRFDISLRACKMFGVAGVIAALLVPAALYIHLRGGLNKNKLPPQNLDYPALERVLKAHGPVATILAPHPLFAGNLRLLDPSIKTLFAETPSACERLARPLVLLWDGAPALPASLYPILFRAGIKVNMNGLPVDLAYREAQDVRKKLYYLYIP